MRIAVAAAALALLAGGALAILRSEIIDIRPDQPRPLSRETPQTEATPEEAATLRAVGLIGSPVLDDTGIAIYLDRLACGKVTFFEGQFT